MKIAFQTFRVCIVFYLILAFVFSSYDTEDWGVWGRVAFLILSFFTSTCVKFYQTFINEADNENKSDI